MRGRSKGKRAKERSMEMKGSVQPIPSASPESPSGLANKREGVKREKIKKRVLDIEKPLSHL
jgi:hypothetical protein